MRADEITSIVNEFWGALNDQMPEAFAEANDYALFKSGGVGPLHLVLRDLLTKMYLARRTFTKDEFRVMIHGSELLTNSEFLKSDNDDGVRIYSGKASWPDLDKRTVKDIEEEGVTV